MSIKHCIDNYSFRVSEQEHQFRDLFGKEELKEARASYYSKHRTETYLEYLKQETERKLREQDGD